ncbi:MAG: glycosyltransferase family 39 protein [Elusimicrobiota bacterium]
MNVPDSRRFPFVAIAAALAALLFADYIYTAWTWLAWNRHPGLAQDPWLLYALDVREGVSVPMGNDHPLYPFILSLWAGRTPAAFTISKLFSLALGAATLIAAYRVGGVLFGRPAGLLAAACLSVNWIFLSLSMSLRAEVLLPLLFLLNWYCVWRGFSESGAWWLAAGAFAGLAYLAKGTGTLLVLSWAGAAAVVWLRDKSVWRKAPWYLAGFLPLAAILWWGNHQLFGDMTYNFSVRHAMWLDVWQGYSDRPLETLSPWGYVASHGLSGVVRRVVTGVWRFAPVSAACLSPASSFPLPYMLRWPLFLAAVAAVWTTRRRILAAFAGLEGGAWFTGILWALFFVLFSWYHQVSPSERFVGPLNPVIFILIAAAAAGAWEVVESRLAAYPSWRRRVVWLLGGVALLTAAALSLKVRDWGWRNPFAEDRPAACYRHVYEWVSGREEPVLYGPSGDLPFWLLRARPPTVGLPEGPPPEDLARWLAERKVRGAVVDWDMADSPFLGGYFETAGGQGVRMKRPLPGWRTVYADPHHRPPHVLLLERD